MASRRTVSRAPTTKTAPTHDRTRSASIRPPPPPKPTPSLSSTIPSTTSSLPNQPQGNGERSGSNIQVVIRCRGRSEREIQENSSIIVTSDGAKSKEISIETDAAQSTLGVVTPPSTRTYPFDLVFGPEADQAMIYHEVVSPMLDEVLQGYNCTLFAYGQTGTGKTYTMHGDLKPSPMGNPSSDAGMIPRVLFRLFHSLEKSNLDYSVKLSYIELYNEELRDLFANELAPPSGSTQPMGMGNKGTTDGLKIFDDANKKGVFIQGLEEIAVKDCKDALNLLTKGSERRQIAATRFNDHSSRSHSILTMTVHVKETSTIGDDLLRIGKLNLVDLAGSENIGRSGAENKRAREAGMINQSLLTLGRVINALVDNAQHVPYRESKLTRLLQDSLGGRTKTCIIATVSPARSNLEETLSTLDYALRAKSIRNKPEVNQRMTRNGLLKEYIAEIERLKTDLLAAREKNGIYFSEESWNQLNSEQEMQRTQLHESRKHIEIIESQMRAVREEFEQSIGLLLKRDEELKEVKGKLEKTEIALVNVEGELNEKKVALDEEVVVRRAHQDTEKKLNIVAQDLKNVTTQTLQDIGGLFEKLERKSSVLDLNTQTVTQCEQTMSSLMQAISQRLNELKQSTKETATNLQTMAKDTETTEIHRLSSLTQTVTEQLTLVRNAVDTIHTSDQNETGALQSAQDILDEMQTTFKEEFLTWGQNLTSTYSRMCDDLEKNGHKEFSTVENALGSVYSILEKVLREVQDYIKNELGLVQQVRVVAEKAAEEEILHLRQQNNALVQMLKNEKMKADIAKETILHRMSEMLDAFTNEQNSRLQESVDDLRDQNMQAEGTLETFLRQHQAMQNQATASGSSMNASLEKHTGVAKRTRDGALKTLEQTKATVQKTMHTMRDQVLGSVSSHTKWVEQQTTSYTNVTTQAWKQHSRAKRIRLNVTDALGKDLPTYYGQLQEGLASGSKCLENALGSIATQAGTLSETASTHHSRLRDELDTLESINQRLAEHGTRLDVPTGLTPQKKRWAYVDHWDLTRSRETILDTWRRDGKPERRSTIAPERIPLPEDEEEEDEDMEGEDEELAEVPFPVPTPTLARSSTPTSSLSGSGSTMPTPQDSPDSLFSSITSNIKTSIPEPIRPRKTATRTSSIIPPAAPVVNPRRKNIVTSRPRRTNAR